jgi:hypothetical protein
LRAPESIGYVDIVGNYQKAKVVDEVVCYSFRGGSYIYE